MTQTIDTIETVPDELTEADCAPVREYYTSYRSKETLKMTFIGATDEAVNMTRHEIQDVCPRLIDHEDVYAKINTTSSCHTVEITYDPEGLSR